MHDIAKKIWEYLLQYEITITAEYLPSALNLIADWESRHVRDSTEWKLDPNIFSGLCRLRGHPEIDLFASRLSNQLPQYMSLKQDPFSLATDAMQQDWSHKYMYAFPPFNMVGQVLKKTQDDQCQLLIITPIWVTQPWYPLLLQMSIEHPVLIPNKRGLLKNPQGEHHPLILNASLTLGAWLVSGRDWYQKEYQKGLLNSSQILDQRGQNPVTNRPGRNLIAGVVWSPIQAVLDFLADLFDQGLVYRTIGCYRSAISAYHEGINGISVGKHPRVTALMGGASVERPPQPKYCMIWDVEQVLQFIRTLPPNQELTTKMLILKLTMLLALSASHRCSELKTLDLRWISRSDDSISFEFGCRLKHTKRGKLSPPVTYYPIACEPDLCPVTTLNHYITHTKTWREGLEGGHQLLLSTLMSHKPVCKSTIARWVKEVLKLSGIDIMCFEAHSSRSAATSKAKVGCLKVEDILKKKINMAKPLSQTNCNTL